MSPCVFLCAAVTAVAALDGVREFVSIDFSHTFAAHMQSVSGSCVKSINLIYT